MPIPKVVWTLEVLYGSSWRLLPGYWSSYEAAEKAFQDMMPSLNRRDQIPTSHKVVARRI